ERPRAVVGVDDGDDGSELRVVRLHVRARPEEPLLLAAPQDEAERAARHVARRGDGPSALEHRRDAGAVVLRAGAEVPRVEVRTDDDPLVGLVAATQL